MKTLAYATLVILLGGLFCSAGLEAQHRGYGEGEAGPRPERLDKFRKMRLVESLKLNEEDAIRFFAKQSAHEDSQRDLLKARNTALDELGEIDRGEGNEKDLAKLSDDVMTVDQKMFKERQRYQDEIRKFLKPDQFAKFLLFERSFNRKVKDALEEMREDRRPKNKY